MKPRPVLQDALSIFFLVLVGTWLTTAWPGLPARGEQTPTSAVQAHASPVPTHYMGREIAKTMHYSGAAWLLREPRQQQEDCQRLLEELDVQPGQVICDLGSGNGFYTLKLARLTGPEGKVYAVDIQQEMLDLLKDRARRAKVDNIVPLLGTATDPGLPENALDLVLMADVYHELSRPEEMLRMIGKSLKPSGRIALVEFREEDPGVPIKPLHKMSKRQMRKEFLANGFKMVGEFDGLPWQHVMYFARNQAPTSADDR